jgi:hypothetical protein
MSEPEKQLPDQVAPSDGGVKAVRRQRRIRGRVYYEERRKRVAELRAIGNLTFDQIGERITAYGFEPMTGERAWRDYQLYMKESAKALNAVEHRSEIVTKFEGLFSLAIMAYKDAQRQTKEGTKVPDPYAQGILLQRAMEILERLAELYGFLSRRGFSVTQTVNTDQKQMAFSFREMVNQHRLARGLAPLPPDDK